MTGNNDNFEARSFRTAGLLLVFLVIAAIVFVIIKALVLDQPLNPQALQQALIAACIGVTVSCLIVWLLNLLKIVSIQEGWGKLLWGILIASVLGNSAVIYKRFSLEERSAAPLRLVCMRTLVAGESEEIKHPYALKIGLGYKPGDYLSYFASFTDFAENSSGEFSVEFRTSVENVSRRSTTYWDESYKANFKKMAADPARIKRTQEYSQVAPECVGKKIIQAAFSYKLPEDLAPGHYSLRITMRDASTGAIASDAMAIELSR